MITIRELALPADGDADAWRFVFDAWAHSLADALAAEERVVSLEQVIAEQCNDGKLTAACRHWATLVTSKPGARVFLACAEEAPDTFLGFAAFVGARAEYVYVKHNVRKHGIGRKLLWETNPELLWLAPAYRPWQRAYALKHFGSKPT